MTTLMGLMGPVRFNSPPVGWPMPLLVPIGFPVEIGRGLGNGCRWAG